MTAPPIEQAALEYLRAVCAGITTAAGYRTNAGLSVWIDEPEFAPEQADTDALRTVLLDERIDPRGAHQYSLIVVVRGRVYCERERTPYPRALCRAWLADIRQAMAAADPMDDRYPIGVERITFQGSTIPEREPQSNWLYPEATYALDFANRAAI